MKNKFFVALALAMIGCALTVLPAQTSPATMKAIVVHEFGGPEVLKYEDVPKPEAARFDCFPARAREC